MKNIYFFLVVAFFSFKLNSQIKSSYASRDFNYSYLQDNSTFKIKIFTKLKDCSKQSHNAVLGEPKKLEGSKNTKVLVAKAKQHKQYKQNEPEIGLLIEDDKTRELLSEKKKLISINKQTLLAKINIYNEMLLSSGCDKSISRITINEDNLLTNELLEIKLYFLGKLKKVTKNYLASLNQCTLGYSN